MYPALSCPPPHWWSWGCANPHCRVGHLSEPGLLGSWQCGASPLPFLHLPNAFFCLVVLGPRVSGSTELPKLLRAGVAKLGSVSRPALPPCLCPLGQSPACFPYR